MDILITFLFIAILSIVLAARSMKDFDSGNEIRRYVRKKKKGTIVFLKKGVKHYSS